MHYHEKISVINISTWFWASDRARWSGLWDLCAICINTPTLVVLYTTLYVKVLSNGIATRQILPGARWRGKEIYLLLLTRCEWLFCKVGLRKSTLKMLLFFPNGTWLKSIFHKTTLKQVYTYSYSRGRYTFRIQTTLYVRSSILIFSSIIETVVRVGSGEAARGVMITLHKK